MPHKEPKRVHFVDHPDPGSPSPAFTNTSLPSSSSSSAGPRTPSDVDYVSLPPATMLKQKQRMAAMASPAFSSLSFGSSTYSSGQVLVHPDLAAGTSNMMWNLTVPAMSTYPADRAAQPATHPPLPEIEIICNFLPWTITVRPVSTQAWSPSAVQTVTVGDVLHTIYRTLRLAVSDPEFRQLSLEHQARVTAAYQTRVAQVATSRERKEENAKGIKRVDFLMEARGFIGLSMATDPGVLRGRGLGQVWVLNVAMA